MTTESPATDSGGRRATGSDLVKFGLAAGVVATAVLFARLLLVGWLFGGMPAMPAMPETVGIAVVFATLYLVAPIGVFLALIPVLRYVWRAGRPVLVAAFTVLLWLLVDRLTSSVLALTQLDRYVPDYVLSGASVGVLAVCSFVLLSQPKPGTESRS